MKAIVYNSYGTPEQLKLIEVEKPIPKDDEIMVRVYAVSLNASDWELLTGKPGYIRMYGLFKPRKKIIGSDVSGIVLAVGTKVQQFKVGDEVYGDTFEGWGGLAEYVCRHEKAWVLKPASLSFAECAALPQAGVVALQSVRGRKQAGPGKRVLINGAGGGSGSFAIQLAKRTGAEVTGVDSWVKGDFMRSLGADHVIDYKREDYSNNGQKYDLIIDLVAGRSIFKSRRALAPGGRYLLVGGSTGSILQTLIIGSFLNLFGSRKSGILHHKQNQKDMTEMADLFEAGRVWPRIDKTFPLEETAEAMRYMGEGHALGKVVVTVAREQ